MQKPKSGSSKKKLFDGTIIYFIGNASTAFLQFLLLPYITGILDPDAYGYFNLVVVTAMLVTPAATLSVTEALFRFFFDSDQKDKKVYFTNTIFIIITGIVTTILLTSFIHIFIIEVPYLFLVIMYFVSGILFVLYQKVIRSLGHSKEFVKSNFIRAFLYIIFQIVLLIGFGIGIESLFISSIVSIIITILYLEFKVKLRRFFAINLISKKAMKELISFSAPLIPNSILWWIVSSVNAYIITIFISVDANGIYSVAGKFGGLISMVSSVFLIAWQEMVIIEHRSTDKKKFYSEVSNLFIRLLFSVALVMIPLIKIVMPYMIDPKYYESLIYAPILALGAAFAAMTGFYGAGYLASKKTSQSMWTTIYGVGVNIIISIIGIHYIGLFAPVLGVTCANLAIWIVRHRTLSVNMGISLQIKTMFFLSILISIALAIYYLFDNTINILFGVLFIMIGIWLNQVILRKTAGYAYTSINKLILKREK